MSAGDRDTLALVLAKHDHWNIDDDADMTPRCVCGHPVMVDGRIAHRAHVADVIASSDWLREQRTEAWDKCCDLHFREGDDPYGPIGSRCDRNPYRTTEDTDAH